jgi:phage terminase large subunit-like protein
MTNEIKDIEDYRSYLGNINLKRKGVTIEWTEDMVQEFVKCAKDPIYFAERYIQIVHVDHGLIPIVLYDYQKEIITKTINNRRTCVVTSRQAGKTTTAVCLILHYILFNDHKLVALLANKGDAAREILERIKIAYEALPKWLQQGVVEWNKGSVEFENGSKILAGATSSSAIRGKSVSFLYIDETAFVENWDEFFASVFPTISSGKTTKILLTSTPNGLNHFYKTCEGAKAGKNGYQFTKVMWYDVPGRDEAWRQETLSAMDFDTEKFAQEMECEFLGSSGTLISGAKLKQLVYKEPLKEVGGIVVYEEPKSEGNYVIVVDVSRGKGLDYSAFQVIDISQMPYVQVGAYRNNMITPIDYASAVHAAAKYFNEANILVEVNDIGEQVASILFEEYEYENMLLTENNGREGKRLLSGVAGFSGKADKGIRTTKSVKSVGCSMIKLLIEQNQLIVNDFETIREFSTFSQKGTSFEAEPGNHDDLVMCMVLFGWLSNQRFFKELTDINTVINLREMNEEQAFSELIPFGIIDSGHDEHEEKPLMAVSDDKWLF